VNRTNGSAGTVGISHATANGPAIAGTDYAATSGALSFGDGQTANTFSVPGHLGVGLSNKSGLRN
jgi:hypothetical protein